MRPTRRRSILRKLTLMNMLVSGAALSLACLAFLRSDHLPAGPGSNAVCASRHCGFQ
jgi:hypothetical protein